ncbi:MAG: glycosyltransferase [Chloroflexota bacterium]|nr:glycosyltransferase [Chloroflexota bacterium]MDE2908230.1 glycosyltransferase [Chloroflexota bacterium]
MLMLLQTTYALCALLLGLYTAGQALLLWRFWRTRRARASAAPPRDLPPVTVQLPLFNELEVAGRLIEAVAAFDYPRDKLLIQALDDSNDLTVQLVARKLAELEARGYRVQHIRRANRDGFKAGALAAGLSHCDCEFIAIFDADFIPPPDFLRRTLPHLLADPGLGIAQSRWSHLNAEENSLTRAQRLSIDTHFAVEQAARNRSGWLIPFNGTGGVWRRSCIEAAGGWSASTLTEDLDLSYRAQLAGWRSQFLPDVEAPGEIPPQLAAYKQQQARWATGNTQCLLKLARPIIAAKLSAPQKIMAIQHLCQYLPQPLMLLMLLLTPPLLLAEGLAGLSLAPLGIIGLAPPLMYIAGQMQLYGSRGAPSALTAFPALLFIGTGLSLSNSLAVASGLLGFKPPFRRTPKFERDWKNSRYALSADVTLWLELALTLYAFWAAALAWELQRELCLYLLIYALSLGTVVCWSLRESWIVRRAQANPASHKAANFGETI